MSEQRDLAQRAVDSFLTLVHRGTRLAAGTLAVVVLICVGGLFLGLAALSGGVRTAWILLGGIGAVVAIGCLLLAMFRLWAITTLSVALVSDIRTLISSDPGSERVVIETVESSDDVQDQSAVVMSRQFFAMSDSVGGRAGQFVALSLALKSVTSFPLLIALATAITVGFAGLSMLFMLGLIF
ncbi:MAG TPA: hypothetical protein VES40_06955 [Ilumatobacteraceae bacterium]|nr:hypothetical protein [Ilumatobacteraceae bacterium]